ncbi:NADH dehydrogenase subunit J [Bowdeniella nasicola]|uniref:NADH-quinone oxidoreductase subunit J n=1 Tax=Bowdeniella nasicola TaxID=208480 RepID=A0A1H3XDT4_9ACTO|nr:NADH-quinone oxidoreductase subunit J [Bowdeniella nasicola]SDZ96762.1 NADH dehydrogenase subunit J [Bowdeniella nasicola]
MSPLLPLAVAPAAEPVIGTGETVLFWIMAPLMVIFALGLIFAKKAVYAAVSIVFVMICLAFMYTALEAPFLGVAQVVVYTGAIMMLFLFVLMLVGVDASDSLVETIKNQRWVSAVAALGLVIVLAGALGWATLGQPAGLAEANAATNPVGVAEVIFGKHVFAMELTGALLITAALGALTLTHRDRLHRAITQRTVADAKMRAWARGDGRISQLPTPGVYARHNAADVPALAADGSPINASVPKVLRVRGQQREIGEFALDPAAHVNDHVAQSGLANMPGTPAPELPAAMIDEEDAK